jgi:hypothetical protein
MQGNLKPNMKQARDRLLNQQRPQETEFEVRVVEDNDLAGL